MGNVANYLDPSGEAATWLDCPNPFIALFRVLLCVMCHGPSFPCQYFCLSPLGGNQGEWKRVSGVIRGKPWFLGRNGSGEVGHTSVCQALVLYRLHLNLQLKGNEIKTLAVINRVTFVILLGATEKEVHWWKYNSCFFVCFQITRLKIDRNPFAKGFRDSGRNR